MPPVYFLYSSLKKRLKGSGKNSNSALPDYPGTLPVQKSKWKNPLPPLFVATSSSNHQLHTIPESSGYESASKTSPYASSTPESSHSNSSSASGPHRAASSSIHKAFDDSSCTSDLGDSPTSSFKTQDSTSSIPASFSLRHASSTSTLTSSHVTLTSANQNPAYFSGAVPPQPQRPAPSHYAACRVYGSEFDAGYGAQPPPPHDSHRRPSRVSTKQVNVGGAAGTLTRAIGPVGSLQVLATGDANGIGGGGDAAGLTVAEAAEPQRIAFRQRTNSASASCAQRNSHPLPQDLFRPSKLPTSTAPSGNGAADADDASRSATSGLDSSFASSDALDDSDAYKVSRLGAKMVTADNLHQSLQLIRLADHPWPTRTTTGAAFEDLNADAVSLKSPATPLDDKTALLEVMLRERESEILHLRRAIEHNEKVIFQVYERRQSEWEKSLVAAQKQNNEKMEQQRKAALQQQQQLLMQVFALQQERRSLQDDNASFQSKVQSLLEETDLVKEQLEAFKSQLEDTRWEMCQKSGEIALLKQHVREARDSAAAFSSESATLRAQLAERETRAATSADEARRLQAQLEKLEEEIARLNGEVACRRRRVESVVVVAESASGAASSSSTPTDAPGGGVDARKLSTSSSGASSTSGAGLKEEHVTQLKRELREMHNRLHEQQKGFETERGRWLAEKSKVLNYQCKLQENYLAMCHRCQHLEQTIFQLTMELDRQTNGDNGAFEPKTEEEGRRALAGQVQRQQLQQQQQLSQQQQRPFNGDSSSESSWRAPQSPSEKAAPARIEDSTPTLLPQKMLQLQQPQQQHLREIEANGFQSLRHQNSNATDNRVLESVHL